MPTFPLYKAVKRLEDSWDLSPDHLVGDQWSFVPIPYSETTNTGRFVIHVEGGAEPYLWFKAEIGSAIRDGPGGPRLFTRTARGGLDAHAVAAALRTLATEKHGLTRTPTPERAPTDDAATFSGPDPDPGPAPTPDPSGESRRPVTGVPDRGVTDDSRLPAVPGDPPVDATPGTDPGPPPGGRRETYEWAVWRCLARDHGDTRPPTFDEIQAVTRNKLNAGEAAAFLFAARALVPDVRRPEPRIEAAAAAAAGEPVSPKRRSTKPSNPRQASLF